MFILHDTTKHIIFGLMAKKNLFYLNPKIEEKTIYVALRERKYIWLLESIFSRESRKQSKQQQCSVRDGAVIIHTASIHAMVVWTALVWTTAV